jgi:hypothetical protein
MNAAHAAAPAEPALLKPKRKLPSFMTVPKQDPKQSAIATAAATEPLRLRDAKAKLAKAIEDAEFAVELLEAQEEKAVARQSRKDWNLYDYIGQEEEDQEEEEEEEKFKEEKSRFDLSDTDVAANMSTDEALAIVHLAQAPKRGPYPHKTNRARLLHDLRRSLIAATNQQKKA